MVITSHFFKLSEAVMTLPNSTNSSSVTLCTLITWKLAKRKCGASYRMSLVGATRRELRKKVDNEQLSQVDRTQETRSAVFIRSEPADKAS